MTTEEALAVLEQRRITRSLYDPTRLVLHHDDGTSEQIGELYPGQQSIIYVAEYIPSQIGMTYSDVKKSVIDLERPISEELLQSAIDDLPISSLRYTETLRQERIANVKQYFKERELKRRRHAELILSLERGEHLSREELQELSVMGYTI